MGGWLVAGQLGSCIVQPSHSPQRCRCIACLYATRLQLMMPQPALPTVPRLLGAPGWCCLSRVSVVWTAASGSNALVACGCRAVRLLALIRASSSSLFAADQSCACTRRRKVPPTGRRNCSSYQMPTGLACVAFAANCLAQTRHCSFRSRSAAGTAAQQPSERMYFECNSLRVAVMFDYVHT